MSSKQPPPAPPPHRPPARRIAIIAAVTTGVIAIAVAVLFTLVVHRPQQTAAPRPTPAGTSRSSSPSAGVSPSPTAAASPTRRADPIGAPVQCDASRPMPLCFDDRLVKPRRMKKILHEKLKWKCFKHGDKIPELGKHDEVGGCEGRGHETAKGFYWTENITWTNLHHDPKRRLDSIDAFVEVTTAKATGKPVKEAEAVKLAKINMDNLLKVAFGSHTEISDPLRSTYESSCGDNADGTPHSTSTGYNLTCNKPFYLDVGGVQHISMLVSVSSYP